MSGLVNAPYAKPDPGLRLKSVKVRRYRGYCTASDTLRDALRAVVRRRDEIIQVVEKLPGSSEKDTESRSRYLQDFFRRAANEEKLLRKFEKRCL